MEEVSLRYTTLYLGFRKVEGKKAEIQTNEQTKQKHTHKYREQRDGCQRGEGGGMDKWVKGNADTGFRLGNEKVMGMKATAQGYSQWHCDSVVQ